MNICNLLHMNLHNYWLKLCFSESYTYTVRHSNFPIWFNNGKKRLYHNPIDKMNSLNGLWTHLQYFEVLFDLKWGHLDSCLNGYFQPLLELRLFNSVVWLYLSYSSFVEVIYLYSNPKLPQFDKIKIRCA